MDGVRPRVSTNGIALLDIGQKMGENDQSALHGKVGRSYMAGFEFVFDPITCEDSCRYVIPTLQDLPMLEM